MLGPILLSLHNLAYYMGLMRQAREAIANDLFLDFYRERMAGLANTCRLIALVDWGYRF